MKPANLVIEIKDGNVVAVTSTNPDVSYIVFNHDSRTQNLDTYQVDMCIEPKELESHIQELINNQPEKPQEHIKTMFFYCDDSVQSRVELPDGETITIELPGEAMKGKSLEDKRAILMQRIDRHRACSQANMNQ